MAIPFSNRDSFYRGMPASPSPPHPPSAFKQQHMIPVNSTKILHAPQHQQSLLPPPHHSQQATQRLIQGGITPQKVKPGHRGQTHAPPVAQSDQAMKQLLYNDQNRRQHNVPGGYIVNGREQAHQQIIQANPNSGTVYGKGGVVIVTNPDRQGRVSPPPPSHVTRGTIPITGRTTIKDETVASNEKWRFVYSVPQMIKGNTLDCVLKGDGELGGLYIGNIDAALTAEILKHHKIRAVLTTSVETGFRYAEEVVHFHECLPAHDNQGYDITVHFEKGIEFIERNRRYTSVLVHCFAGVSRSASICIAYLMKHERWGLERALWHLKKCRRLINPNTGFIKKLTEYEKYLTAIGHYGGAVKRAEVSSPNQKQHLAQAATATAFEFQKTLQRVPVPVSPTKLIQDGKESLQVSPSSFTSHQLVKATSQTDERDQQLFKEEQLMSQHQLTTKRGANQLATHKQTSDTQQSLQLAVTASQIVSPNLKPHHPNLPLHQPQSLQPPPPSEGKTLPKEYSKQITLMNQIPVGSPSPPLNKSTLLPPRVGNRNAHSETRPNFGGIQVLGTGTRGYSSQNILC